MNRIPRLAALIALAAVALNTWAAHYTCTFSGTVFTASGQTASLGGLDWTLTTDAGYFGSDPSKGQQTGSARKPAKTLQLVSAGLTGTVTSVTVTTCGASGVNATLTVSVGGEAFGTSAAITSTPSDVVFTGNREGQVTLSYTQTSSKALYISRIDIVTDGTPVPQPAPVPTVTSIADFVALAEGIEARLYLSADADARVTFVYGQNAYLRDATGALCLYGFAKTPAMAYNQHVAGYLTGRRSTVGNMPVMEATARTSTRQLIIAEPVSEDNVQPVSITASQLTDHYADWVTVSYVTMTDSVLGHDATGSLRLVNSFRQTSYQAPDAGSLIDVSGIVNSTRSDGDRLSPISNTATARACHPEADYAHFFPAITLITANGIGAVTQLSAGRAAVYDLTGRRVTIGTGRLPKGIYITGGRKIIIK